MHPKRAFCGYEVVCGSPSNAAPVPGVPFPAAPTPPWDVFEVALSPMLFPVSGHLSYHLCCPPLSHPRLPLSSPFLTPCRPVAPLVAPRRSLPPLSPIVGQVIGTIGSDLDCITTHVRTRETTVGNLVCDIALVRPGGLPCYHHPDLAPPSLVVAVLCKLSCMCVRVVLCVCERVLWCLCVCVRK